MNYKSSFWILILIIFHWSIVAKANIFTITNTNDSGTGSLRWAITNADTSATADTILFNIPISDVGFNSSTGVWTIQPTSELPIINGDSTIIDGTSQNANQGDTNPNGPEIEIDGTNVNGNGFSIKGSANKILGLIINRFSDYGIIISFSNARSNTIAGNYIGTDASGEIALGNILGGVLINGYAENNVIGGLSPAERNIISGASHHGNIYHGNGVTIKGRNYNRIIGNFIGTNKDGTAPLGNVDYGISITYGQENIVGGLEPGAGNVISGNNLGGIFIRFSETMNNTIHGNFIGTDVTGLLNLGNFREGIYLDYGTKNNVIGPHNVIANNGHYGVIVNHDSTVSNTITQNSIFNHSELGIFNEEGGNVALVPPIIQEVTDTYVSGTACPNCIVEIFSDSSNEGSIYEGAVTADASGNFLWTGMPSGPNITATATDTAGNTSEFSSSFVTKIEEIKHTQIPKGYFLHQNFTNPFNPETEICFDLPEACQVILKIYNIYGQEIVTLINSNIDAGYHSLVWNSKDNSGRSVSSGIYLYQIKAGEFVESKKMSLLR